MWRLVAQYSLLILCLSLKSMHISRATFIANHIPLWTWECIEEKCVPFKAIKMENLQSLATCNMLCASMQLWPQPTGPVSLSSTAVPVRADLFKLSILRSPSTAVHEHVQDAFQLLRDDLRKMEDMSRGFAEWRVVIVRVIINGSGDPRMRLDTNESYYLSLEPKDETSSSLWVDIFANSFCGARHGLETLSQLIWLDPYAGSLMIIEAANIYDAPRFPYRGLLLDTAHNYIPVGEIIHTIDAMAACKLNTFHWHASDSQAFTLRLSSIPQLAQYGAYGPGVLYSPEEVRAVVRRARLRGIRVLIEVDVPAHVGRAWTWGPSANLGNLIQCLEIEPWIAYCEEPPCGQLNPRNPHIYELLERVYSEIILLTGVDDIFHLGGDDVSERCWMLHFNETEYIALWLEFTRSILDRLQNLNGRLPNLTILWSSRLSEQIKTDLKEYSPHIGIQARNVAWSQKYVTGIRTIISHEDAWDLNSGMGTWYKQKDGAPYNSWQKIYEHRPWSRGAIGNMEGGEATVWSTYLSAGGLDAQVWPRAAALAERLWSDRAEGATRPVYARLDVQRSRLISRGVQAAPMWSMWCTHNPYTCT